VICAVNKAFAIATDIRLIRALTDERDATLILHLCLGAAKSAFVILSQKTGFDRSSVFPNQASAAFILGFIVDKLLTFTFASLHILVFTIIAGLSTAALAAEPVSKSRFAGVAIGGKDTVAYHSLEKAPQASAVGGKKSYTVSYKGAKWRFLSKASAELFSANPEKYEPAYNGHCANALSLGNGLVKTNGKHWEILNDKLYLFYAAAGRDRWTDGNWKTYKVASDAAWAKLGK